MTALFTPPHPHAPTAPQAAAPAPSPSAPASAPIQPTAQEARAFAQKLRAQTIAVRVRHEKLGIRRALTREQLKRAAEEFNADAKAIRASKKLLDTRDPKYRAVVRVRSTATQYWRSHSAPYPEKGVRLIRRDQVAEFERRMKELAGELNAAVAELQEHYEALRERARVQLGELFNAGDYPARVDGEFSLDWDYPSVEPPDLLKQLHPDLYEQEMERVRGRFEEAVRLTEEAFAVQLQKLVAHLAEKLRGDADGKPMVFRDTAVEKLHGFFEQFRSLSVGGSEQLAKLVDQAQEAVKGVTPADLRGDAGVRGAVAGKLAEVQAAIDELMVNRPGRMITMEEE